jgi:multicomponent Na+:H+ antiporter subunit F
MDSKKTKILRWLVGAIILIGIIALIIIRPLSSYFGLLANLGFLGRIVYIFILGCVLCLYRICRGPTAADRIVAIDILGIIVVGLCAVLTVTTNRSWYIDIGIAWALQSFISTLALSKYLEGRDFDE